MTDPNQERTSVISDPRELKETPLGRRRFMEMVAGGSSLVLGPSLAGCLGEEEPDDDEPIEDSVPEELVLARAGDSDALDPHVTTLAYSSMVMTWIYDPLIIMDFDLEPHPAIGQGWEVNDEGTEWTIEITDGLEFHNGDPVTADDVAFTYNRALEESLIVWSFGSMYDVETVDDSTVRFHFEEPYAPWESYSGSNSGYYGVVPQGPVEEDPDGFASNPVGSGPYEFEEWVRDDHITLVRNDNWETPTYPEVESDDPPLPRRLTFQVIPEETPRVQSLKQGDVDVLISRDFPPRQLADIQEDENTQAEVFTSNNAGYITFNMDREPTDDVRVRQALSHAVDVDRIIEDIYHGLGQQNWVPMSENLMGWAGEAVREEYDYSYDLDKARDLLEEAGWEDVGNEYRQRDGEELELELVSTNTPPPRLQLAEELVDMYSQIGVNVDLTAFEYGTAYDVVEEGDSHIFYATVAWFEPDILNFVWHSDNAGLSNLSFYRNDEVDDLIERAAQAIDPNDRRDLYEELQLTAMADYPTKPVMTYEDAVGLRTGVQEYKQHPTMLTPLYHDVTFDE